MTTARDNSWHLDKRVPLTIIIVFMIQTVTLVYVGTSWKTDIDSRVSSLERVESRSLSYEGRIIILEQGVLGIREDLSEIKEILRNQRQGHLNQKPKLIP